MRASSRLGHRHRVERHGGPPRGKRSPGAVEDLEATSQAVSHVEPLPQRRRAGEALEVAGQVPARDRTPKCSPRASTLASRCARGSARRSSVRRRGCEQRR